MIRINIVNLSITFHFVKIKFKCFSNNERVPVIFNASTITKSKLCYSVFHIIQLPEIINISYCLFSLCNKLDDKIFKIHCNNELNQCIEKNKFSIAALTPNYNK